jgi:integrase
VSIAKRPDGRWRARYRDAAGNEHSRHFDRKIDASQWLDGVTSAVVTSTYVDPKLGRVTVGAWAKQWLAAQLQLKESTRVRYAGLLARQVLPTWDSVRLTDVSHADVAKWVTGLSASGLAPSSVRQAHRVLSLVLGLAVRDGRLPRNPADGAPLPRASKPDKRFLTAAEVAGLADEAGDHGLVIRVLAYTGLRYGELAALRVRRVDLLRRRLEVAESVTEVAGKLVTGTPKTHQRRSVPIPRSLVDELAVLMAGKAPDDLVFTAPYGGTLRLMNFRRRTFDPAAERAGLGGLTPHELRHTAASLAVSAGANVKAVQRMLGHASAAMTLDVYSGLFDDDLDGLADRLDAVATFSAADFLRTKTAVLPITKSH